MSPPKQIARFPLWKRRLIFRIRTWRHPLAVFRDGTMRWGYTDESAPLIDGVGIVSVALDTSDEQRDRFAAYMTDALRIIRTFDPVRYRRVVKHLRFLVNAPCRSSASYEHGAKACRIDFNDVALEDEGTVHPWYVAHFAKSIVHEATHAYLMDHFVPYTAGNRARVERICIAQQNIFLTKLPQDPYDFVAEYHLDMTDPEMEEWFAGHATRQAQLRRRLWEQLRGVFRKKSS